MPDEPLTLTNDEAFDFKDVAQFGAAVRAIRAKSIADAKKWFIEAQADSLGAAWKRVEAALPEGWSIDRLVQIWPVGQGWWVGANRGDGSLERAEGPTPEAALVALAEKLEAAK